MPENTPATLRDKGLVLAFDYGRARTGVAVAETITGSVRPLTIVQCQNGAPNWLEMDRLIKEWRPSELVVGLPMTLDGKKTPMSKASRRFAASLGERYHVPVFMHDERLSSREAEQRFQQARAAGRARRRDQRQIDAMAACVILESWLLQASPMTGRNAL